jgi:TIR domain-containing protein
VFLAHASVDNPIAVKLHGELTARGVRTSLDVVELELGDDWDLRLPQAQRSSRMTVVIVSQSTEAAFYEREEKRALFR